MRIVMTISMVFFLFLNLVSAQDVSETDWMPDAELRSAVREELGLGDDEALTQADMTDLTYLKSVRGTLSDLTGLEHATNLTELLLYNNNISDITPLGGLSALEILKLGNNSLSSISPLASLMNLWFLAVQNCGLTDVSPIPDLCFLTHLRIRNNDLTNAHLIGTLPALYDIDITIPDPPVPEPTPEPGVVVSLVKPGAQGPVFSFFEITVQFDEPVSRFTRRSHISNRLIVPQDRIEFFDLDDTIEEVYILYLESFDLDTGFYHVSIGIEGHGKFKMRVPAGAARDSDGNLNRASNTLRVLYTFEKRFRAPRVRLYTATTTIDVFEFFTMTVFFNKPVKRFTIEDLVATGTGEFGGWVSDSKNKQRYTLTVFGIEPGELTFRIREDAAVDEQGGWTPASVEENPTVTFVEAED